jgi:hypothetical protein
MNSGHLQSMVRQVAIRSLNASKSLPPQCRDMDFVFERGPLRQAMQSSQTALCDMLRISAIVDARFRLIVDGVSASSWTRKGCAQAGT